MAHTILAYSRKVLRREYFLRPSLLSESFITLHDSYTYTYRHTHNVVSHLQSNKDLRVVSPGETLSSHTVSHP